jgi:F-type H+-transporting ATPase subunit a
VTLAFVPPTTDELFQFEPIFRIGGFDVTFPTLLMLTMTFLVGLFFWAAFRKPKLVPTGVQNVGETAVDFIDQQIVQPVLGPEGRPWIPYLTALFFFVLFNNLLEVVPGAQFPVTSHMAYPATLAILTWGIFNVVGMKAQGGLRYFKNMMFPPGVPKLVYVLLTPIELFSTLIVRPLSLALRLFANMVAGHMLLSVLFLGATIFIESGIGRVAFVLPFGLGVVLTAFEVFVGGMQAFIFTILTAVYIGGAAHAEH